MQLSEILAEVVPAAKLAGIDAVAFNFRGQQMSFDVRRNVLDMGQVNAPVVLPCPSLEPARSALQLEADTLGVRVIDFMLEEPGITFQGLLNSSSPVFLRTSKLQEYWLRLFNRKIDARSLRKRMRAHREVGRFSGFFEKHLRHGNGYEITQSQLLAYAQLKGLSGGLARA